MAESLCPPFPILVHFLLPPMPLVHSGGVLSHEQIHNKASRSNRNRGARCPHITESVGGPQDLGIFPDLLDF